MPRGRGRSWPSSFTQMWAGCPEILGIIRRPCSRRGVSSGAGLRISSWPFGGTLSRVSLLLLLLLLLLALFLLVSLLIFWDCLLPGPLAHECYSFHLF